MRFAILCLMLAATSACSDRRSFDDRYDDTANTIEQRAAQIDAQANLVDNGEVKPPDRGR